MGSLPTRSLHRVEVGTRFKRDSRSGKRLEPDETPPDSLWNFYGTGVLNGSWSGFGGEGTRDHTEEVEEFIQVQDGSRESVLQILKFTVSRKFRGPLGFGV